MISLNLKSSQRSAHPLKAFFAPSKKPKTRLPFFAAGCGVNALLVCGLAIVHSGYQSPEPMQPMMVSLGPIYSPRPKKAKPARENVKPAKADVIDAEIEPEPKTLDAQQRVHDFAPPMQKNGPAQRREMALPDDAPQIAMLPASTAADPLPTNLLPKVSRPLLAIGFPGAPKVPEPTPNGGRRLVAEPEFGGGKGGPPHGPGPRTEAKIADIFDALPLPPGDHLFVARAETDFRRAQIMNKPTPRYTEEARLNGITGTVRVRVVFGQDGKLRDARIEKGLGSGLDEQALLAVCEISFTPAKLNGATVDEVAVLAVEFNLAK